MTKTFHLVLIIQQLQKILDEVCKELELKWIISFYADHVDYLIIGLFTQRGFL